MSNLRDFVDVFANHAVCTDICIHHLITTFQWWVFGDHKAKEQWKYRYHTNDKGICALFFLVLCTELQFKMCKHIVVWYRPYLGYCSSEKKITVKDWPRKKKKFEWNRVLPIFPQKKIVFGEAGRGKEVFSTWTLKQSFVSTKVKKQILKNPNATFCPFVIMSS